MKLQETESTKIIPAFTPHASTGSEYHYPVDRVHEDPFQEFKPILAAEQEANPLGGKANKKHRLVFAWAYLQYLSNPAFRSTFPDYQMVVAPQPVQVPYTRPGLNQIKYATAVNTDILAHSPELQDQLREEAASQYLGLIKAKTLPPTITNSDTELEPYLRLLIQRLNTPEPLAADQFRFTFTKACSKQYPLETKFTVQRSPKDTGYRSSTLSVISPALPLQRKWLPYIKWEHTPTPIPATATVSEKLSLLGQQAPAEDVLQALVDALTALRQEHPLPDLSQATDAELTNHAATILNHYQAYSRIRLTPVIPLVVLPDWNVLVVNHIGDYAIIHSPLEQPKLPANFDALCDALYRLWNQPAVVVNCSQLVEHPQPGHYQWEFDGYRLGLSPLHLQRIDHILNPPPPVIVRPVDPFEL